MLAASYSRCIDKLIAAASREGIGREPLEVVVNPVHRRLRYVGLFGEERRRRDQRLQRVRVARRSAAQTSHRFNIRVVVAVLENEEDRWANSQVFLQSLEILNLIGVIGHSELLIETDFKLIAKGQSSKEEADKNDDNTSTDVVVHEQLSVVFIEELVEERLGVLGVVLVVDVEPYAAEEIHTSSGLSFRVYGHENDEACDLKNEVEYNGERGVEREGANTRHWCERRDEERRRLSRAGEKH